MRRSVMIVPCLTVLAACQSEQELRHTATLQSQTRGVALSDDGATGYAAMEGTTCNIDANWGCPTADADLPTVDERVLDHWIGTTVGGTDEGVHQIGVAGWNGDADIPVSDLRTAKLHQGGIAILRGDTTTCFRHTPGGDDVAIPGALCADGVSVSADRASGDLYAATAEGVYAVTPQGAQRLGDAALTASWDNTLDQVYVVDTDRRSLMALSPTGQVRWQVEAGTDIRSMHARGVVGEVLVLVDDDGFGRVERRDGSTGKVLGKSLVPAADAELVVSHNGARVALVRTDEVHFYALETGVEPQDLETDEPECITPTRATRD